MKKKIKREGKKIYVKPGQIAVLKLDDGYSTSQTFVCVQILSFDKEILSN